MSFIQYCLMIKLLHVPFVKRCLLRMSTQIVTLPKTFYDQTYLNLDTLNVGQLYNVLMQKVLHILHHCHWYFIFYLVLQYQFL